MNYNKYGFYLVFFFRSESEFFTFANIFIKANLRTCQLTSAYTKIRLGIDKN